MKQIIIQNLQPLTREEEAIKHTLETMQTEGLAQNPRHIQVLRVKLRRIAKETDLFNPIAVKIFISKLNVNGGTKNGFEYIYQKLAELIYEQMEKKTGLFSPKTNWRGD